MQLLQPLTLLLLFLVVRAGDLAISGAIARDVVRAFCYGAVAILALVALILAEVAH